MQRLVISLQIVLATAAISAASAAGSEQSTPGARQINVTSDSAPGWLPSQEQALSAEKTARTFLATKDAGQYDKAYGFLTELDKQGQSLDRFRSDLRKFYILAGPVKERRIVTVTWTKDPANAPFPGVYAAMDFVSTFANIDRYCGYLILFQPSSGGDFRIMREEDNFIDNVSARTIAQQQSPAALEKSWYQLSAHCPNVQSAEHTPIPEQPSSTVGYPTVAAALKDLRSRPGVEISEQHGWTVANDEASKTLWSFPPLGNPAYPSAVKRQFVNADGGVSLQMSILCEASKAACDDLVRDFQTLNTQMIQSLKRPHP